MSFLSVMALSLGYTARARVEFVKRIEIRDRLRYVSESGIYDNIARIKTSNKDNPEMLYLRLVNDLRKDTDPKPGKDPVNMQFKPIGEDYVALSNARAYYTITDEGRKLNINTAGHDSLKGLLIRVAGLKEDEAALLAQSLIDWRDEDNDRAEEEIISNEQVYYQLGGLPYTPKNKPYEIVEEVLLVKDMRPAIYRAILPYITVYGDGKLNINTCPRVLLEALGMQQQQVDKIMTFRERKLSGGGIFTAERPILDQFEGVVYLSDEDKALLEAFLAQGLVSTDSDYYRITSRGNLAYRRESLEISCVVDRTGRVSRWQESFNIL